MMYVAGTVGGDSIFNMFFVAVNQAVSVILEEVPTITTLVKTVVGAVPVPR